MFIYLKGDRTSHPYDLFSGVSDREDGICSSCSDSPLCLMSCLDSSRDSDSYYANKGHTRMNEACDGINASFQSCYRVHEYEDVTSWVGSGSGDVTIEFFTDESQNSTGFELEWKRQDPCEDLECNTGECSVSENTASCQCS